MNEKKKVRNDIYVFFSSGISLTLDQWENLKKHIEAIDKALKQIKK
jgi:hypothetical protein